MDLESMHKIQREILNHLKEHGPSPLQSLYAAFDPNNTGRANEAIADLRNWNYIAVDATTTASITELGLKRLEKGGF